MTGTVAEPRPSFVDGPLRLYIDGEFVGTEDRLTALNPATGEPLAEAPLAGERQVDQAVREEALEPYLQSKSIWLDLEAAVPQSGQGISRSRREGQP